MQNALAQVSPGELALQALFDQHKIPPPPDPEAAEPLFWKARYHEVVTQLREAKGDMLWYWLGQWFQSEGIRAPDKFVPPSAAKRLVKDAKISLADTRNTRAVRIWLPYTEPLVRKTKWLRKENAGKLDRRLEDLGYDSAAIELVTSKHWDSPVEFTCEWVATQSLDTKTEYQPQTLRNSYSRFHAKWWLRVTKCSFCRAEADGEFWVGEESIPYCQEHRPDLLPFSEASAWPDRKGRRWWREDLDICCKPPSSFS